MSKAREIKITAVRRAIEIIVDDFVSDYYICPESRRPTPNQLVKEIMQELEPACQAIKASFEKARPNLSEN